MQPPPSGDGDGGGFFPHLDLSLFVFDDDDNDHIDRFIANDNATRGTSPPPIKQEENEPVLLGFLGAESAREANDTLSAIEKQVHGFMHTPVPTVTPMQLLSHASSSSTQEEMLVVLESDDEEPKEELSDSGEKEEPPEERNRRLVRERVKRHRERKRRENPPAPKKRRKRVAKPPIPPQPSVTELRNAQNLQEIVPELGTPFDLEDFIIPPPPDERLDSLSALYASVFGNGSASAPIRVVEQSSSEEVDAETTLPWNPQLHADERRRGASTHYQSRDQMRRLSPWVNTQVIPEDSGHDLYHFWHAPAYIHIELQETFEIAEYVRNTEQGFYHLVFRHLVSQGRYNEILRERSIPGGVIIYQIPLRRYRHRILILGIRTVSQGLKHTLDNFAKMYPFPPGALPDKWKAFLNDFLALKRLFEIGGGA